MCMKNEKYIMRTLPLNRDVPIRYFLTAIITVRGRESFVAPKWVCKSRVRFSYDRTSASSLFISITKISEDAYGRLSYVRERARRAAVSVTQSIVCHGII